MMIKTAYVNPPIPARSYDWLAYIEDKEIDGPRGWGSSQISAICNLLEIIEEGDEQ